MNHVPQALADAVVQDENGASMPLGPLLEGGPVVLVFVRHFG